MLKKKSPAFPEFPGECQSACKAMTLPRGVRGLSFGPQLLTHIRVSWNCSLFQGGLQEHWINSMTLINQLF